MSEKLNLKDAFYGANFRVGQGLLTRDKSTDSNDLTESVFENIQTWDELTDQADTGEAFDEVTESEQAMDDSTESNFAMDKVTDEEMLMDLVTDKEVAMDKVTDKEVAMEVLSDKEFSFDFVLDNFDKENVKKFLSLDDTKLMAVGKFVQGGAFVDSEGVSSSEVDDIDDLTDSEDRMDEVTESERAMDGATESELAMDLVTDKEMPMDLVTDKEMPMDKVYSKQMPLEKFYQVEFPFTVTDDENGEVDVTYDDSDDRIVFTRQEEPNDKVSEFPLILVKEIDFDGRDDFKVFVSADTLGESSSRFEAHIRIAGDTVLELDGENDDFTERTIDTSDISGRQLVEFGYNATDFGGNDNYVIQYGRFVTE